MSRTAVRGFSREHCKAQPPIGGRRQLVSANRYRLAPILDLPGRVALWLTWRAHVDHVTVSSLVESELTAIADRQLGEMSLDEQERCFSFLRDERGPYRVK